jgi:hypothetical protein
VTAAGAASALFTVEDRLPAIVASGRASALATRLEVGDQSLELLTYHMKLELLTFANDRVPRRREAERTITTRPETVQNGWQEGVVVGRVDRGAAASPVRSRKSWYTLQRGPSRQAMTDGPTVGTRRRARLNREPSSAGLSDEDSRLTNSTRALALGAVSSGRRQATEGTEQHPEVLACPLTLPVLQTGNNESPDSPNRILSSAEWPPPMWSKASSRRAAAAEVVQIDPRFPVRDEPVAPKIASGPDPSNGCLRWLAPR